MQTENILICYSHPDYQTPLLSTYAFRGAEHWCPHCGQPYGFLDGKEVPSTAKLRNRKKRFKKLSADFLDAKSTFVCSQLMWEGKYIEPHELPDQEKERRRQIIKAWEYGQKPLKSVK